MKIGEIVKIPIDQLVKSKLNPRIDVGDTVELQNSLLSTGQELPLIVWKEDGKYGVLIGSRRLDALQNSELKDVECRLFEGTEAEAFELIEAELHHQEEHTPYELGKLYANWGDRCNLKQSEMADKAGVTQESISQHEALFRNLSENVGKRIAKYNRGYTDDKNITFKKALKMATELKGNHKAQETLADIIEQKGADAAKVSKLISNYKANKEHCTSASNKQQKELVANFFYSEKEYFTEDPSVIREFLNENDVKPSSSPGTTDVSQTPEKQKKEPQQELMPESHTEAVECPYCGKEFGYDTKKKKVVKAEEM